MTQRLIYIAVDCSYNIRISFYLVYVYGRMGKYLTSAGSFQIQALLAGLVLCMMGAFDYYIRK